MDVIVVGAGIGGLSAAIGLAARGARVVVLEKNPTVGGKLSEWRQDGFVFDTGPHVLTMLWAFDEILAPTGKRLSDLIELTRLDTICRYHFPDNANTILDAPADPLEATRAIETFAPGEEQGFLKFLSYARQVSEATTEPFLRNDFTASIHGVPNQEHWSQLRGFLALRPWRSLRNVVQECFCDPRLRQIFELYALYSGSHPDRVSGIFATVADVQWRQGTYYVPGGLYQLATSLRSVAENLGVQFRTNTEVSEVLVKGGRARGVMTQNGDRLFADAVVCNADTLTALKQLVPQSARRRYTNARIDKIEPSTSAFVLLLGIQGEYAQLAHHNSFMAEDLNREFSDIFDHQVPAADPTIGVACQTVSDKTKAPTGCSNLFVMTNPPPLGPNFDWSRKSIEYRNLVLNKLERMGLEHLRDRIVVEQMWTPLDLQSRYGAHKGAIYGLSSNGWRNAFLRPPNVSPDVRGLYFVGGSTHPGGGLPLCALSGTTVAKTIAQQHSLPQS